MISQEQFIRDFSVMRKLTFSSMQVHMIPQLIAKYFLQFTAVCMP